jgi:two-component system cell cycle sensor histidine kinase/response regulator CckA
MAAEDVAAQLAREKALWQAEKMETIGRLTGAIAQQFNELLTTVLAHATALGRALPANRDLDALKDTAQRGADLAQKLLGFSRHKALDRQPLILGEFVREMLDTLRRKLPANIDLQFEADPEGGVVEADPGAVRQILLNLVTNARDAMPKGGTLHVAVRPVRLHEADRALHAWVEPGAYVSIALSDTGVGMDQATLARVFEPFFTTKPVAVGTGLGMPMAYGLVKQHRGFLHLYSEVGQGTTAKVYLPVVHEPGMAAEEVGGEDETLRRGSETILLVEDDPAMRMAAQGVLQKIGYNVVTASDGQKGLEAFRANRAAVRLVVTDVVMPKLSGFELYEAIRGDCGVEGREVRVLFTSGFPAPNFRKTVGLDPGVAFVTKPWTANELLQQVRLLLEQTRA